MRLEKIKLSGFKSFVDPTTITFPSNMVGVIGPNGCGKSNIIDAVRWVLGESSAKMLRGESMTDVIFNGSSGRKPVGVASVELIFDNSDAKVGGEFANFSEISVRREVNRESQSHYFLNNTRCRRKDIFNAFYGTGLGARSYSVIEQGMISRFIEAKPEELRNYLEEVAGISKYKARRRETENRINHTRENLARLTDIREELEKQLNVLDRQAKAAQRYKEFKAEERLLKGQLYTINWRDNQAELEVFTKNLNETITQQEQRKSQISSIDTEVEKHKQQQTELLDSFNDAQQRFYEIKNEVARIEQAIQHEREQQQKLLNDKQELENDYQNTQDHLAEDMDTAQELEAEVASLEPKIDDAKAVYADAQHQLSDAEIQMQQWQQEWEAFNSKASLIKQTFEVEKTKIHNLEQQLKQYHDRQLQVDAHLEDIDIDTLSNKLQNQTASLQTSQQQHAQLKAEQQACAAKYDELRTQQKAMNKELDTLHSQHRQALSQRVKLQALQDAALAQSGKAVANWLSAHNLQDNARLLQKINVAQGWEKAVETVLGDYLQAVCVDDFNEIFAAVKELQQGQLLFMSAEHSSQSQDQQQQSLASKVSSPFTLSHLLDNILIADSLEDAIVKRANLTAAQSIITREGLWLGKSWLRINKPENNKLNALEIKKDLQDIEQQVSDLEAQVAVQQQQLENLNTELESHASEKTAQEQRLLAASVEVAELQSQVKAGEQRLAEDQQKQQRLTAEQAQLKEKLSEVEQALSIARATFENAVNDMQHDDANRSNLSSQRDHIQLKLVSAKQRVSELSTQSHEYEVRYQTNLSQLQTIKQNIERSQQRLQSLADKQQQLELALSSQSNPGENLDSKLTQKVEQHVQAERHMNQQRAELERVQQALEDLQRGHSQLDKELSSLRDVSEKIRLEMQSLHVKAETLLEQIHTLEFNHEALLSELAEDSTANVWQEMLSKVENRISRLGAINLAAEEEYAGLQERKIYLDNQNDDLVESLRVLEEAIAKIDKETKTRFKETFDTVNATFKELFPKVFGGGSAYLEMEDDDLLSSGVTVLARPPGKKNSTIHLLSGGEKALTAVSLVFAIFQLNPAPFCLLDEVDAPLDDMNLLRYCSLVKEMSEKVQFIFVTHNKIAMEMAEQLMGVTMHEPGVSRLVTVDVEQAVDMIEAA